MPSSGASTYVANLCSSFWWTSQAVWAQTADCQYEPTHHVVDIFEDGGEPTDDQGELVLGDVDQTLLVVLGAHFTVGVLMAHFDGKLQEEETDRCQSADRLTDVDLQSKHPTLCSTCITCSFCVNQTSSFV